jgi:hypothetical protein
MHLINALEKPLDFNVAILVQNSSHDAMRLVTRSWVLNHKLPSMSAAIPSAPAVTSIAPGSTEAVAAPAPRLSGTLLHDALAAATAIPTDLERADALVALAPRLPGTEPAALRAALAAATAIPNQFIRVPALAALIPRLPEVLLQDALAAAIAISNDLTCAEVFAALAPRLPGTLLHDALAAAIAIPNELERARALAALAPHLFRAALTAATTMQDVARAEALAAVASHLPIMALLTNRLQLDQKPHLDHSFS